VAVPGVSWTAPPRAAWVARFNRGVASSADDLPPGLSPPVPTLAEIAGADWFGAERLLSEGLLSNGFGADDISRYGSDDFLEPLQVVTAALESEAQLHPLGRLIARRYLERLLGGRILLHRGSESASAPASGVEAHGKVVAPIFVVGAPRTGTTVLFRMLAEVDGLRAPRGWEFLHPCPESPVTGVAPVRAAAPCPPIDRIAAAGHELVLPQTIASGLDQIHAYSAHMPKECLSAMAFSFRTEEFISRFHVPSYVDWLSRADMAPAYDMHRRVLLALQRESQSDDDKTDHDNGSEPTQDRWVLKSPVHLGALPTLMETYPDATLVVTHRPPAEVLASVTSLICTLRSAFSDHIDPMAIGAYHLELYDKRFDDLVTFDSDHPGDRVHHLSHRELVADPPAVLAALLDSLRETDALFADLQPSTTGRGGSEESPSRTKPKRSDDLGRHQYDPADFGLQPEVAEGRFDRYRSRFLQL